MKREELVLNVAKALIAKNGQTTTLEIKKQLIEDFPDYFWKQKFISEVMIDNESLFSFTTNGKYRIYTLASSISTAVPVTMTELAKLVNDNKTKFMTISHKKQDNTVNTMTCRILDTTIIGTILAVEMAGPDRGKKKSFYPKDLLGVKVNGIEYYKK